MIVRVQTGTSFKGAGLYYLHDKREEGEQERLTDGRVAWTYALNTMEEEPEQILSEMQKTAFDQPLLKMMSGNRIDGRPTEDTVMTVALAWSPTQHPSKEQMIEGAQSYLKRMGWDELQCLMVAHNDTEHGHVHLILNRVHPETGMTQDQSWVRHRSGQWALAYEREQGKILCPAREEKYGNDGNLNRREWATWQKISQDARVGSLEHTEALKGGEWDALKQGQRDEREAFWKQTRELGRELRGETARSVKSEFADEWQEYAGVRDAMKAERRAYDKEMRLKIRMTSQVHGPMAGAQLRAEQKNHHLNAKAELQAMRDDIAERQHDRLAEAGDEAFKQFREQRNAAYQELLKDHREVKQDLRGDQATDKKAPIAAKEITDRKAAQQNEAAKPKSDRQARLEAADARARTEARNNGWGDDDDSGRDRDR